MNHPLISGTKLSARLFALALGACLLCPIGCVVESLDDESDDLDDIDEQEQGLDAETKLCISKCRSDPATGVGMCRAARHECLQIAKDKAERQLCRADFGLCRETRRACIEACRADNDPKP